MIGLPCGKRLRLVCKGCLFDWVDCFVRGYSSLRSGLHGCAT